MVCDGNNDCWDSSDEAVELQCGEIQCLFLSLCECKTLDLFSLFVLLEVRAFFSAPLHVSSGICLFYHVRSQNLYSLMCDLARCKYILYPIFLILSFSCRPTYLQFRPVHLPDLAPRPPPLYTIKFCMWWGQRLCQRSWWAPELPQPHLPYERVCLFQRALHPHPLPVSRKCMQVNKADVCLQVWKKICLSLNSLINDSSSPGVTVWTTAGMAVMSWAVLMTPAAATSSPAVTEPASLPTTPVTARATVWMVQMRRTACASSLSPHVLLSITCASQASALTSLRCATGRRTARMKATKKAAVRGICNCVTILIWINVTFFLHEQSHHRFIV